MKDDLSQIKSTVKDLEIEADPDVEVDDDYTPDDPTSRESAMYHLNRLKTIAERKLAEGFKIKRVPISHGYKEVWVR